MKSLNKDKIKSILNKDIIPARIDGRIISLFLKQLSILISSGIGLDKALKIIENQQIDKKLSLSLDKINIDLERGLTIDQAFSNNENYFNPMVVAFIKSGEESGNFAKILDELSFYINEESKNKSIIKQAMTYPIILLFVMILIVAIVVNFVLPTFQNLFEKNGQQLPITTRALIDISTFIKNYGFLIVLFLLIFALSLLILRKDKQSRLKLDEFAYKIFIFKKLRQTKLEYQVSRLLYILRSGDIEIKKSLFMIEKSFKNEYIKENIRNITNEISQGNTLSKSISNKDIFSSLFKSMVEIGENSGNLLETLKKSSEYFSNDYIYKLKKLATLAEPVMVIIMSILVGFVVFAIAIPIFDSINTIGL